MRMSKMKEMTKLPGLVYVLVSISQLMVSKTKLSMDCTSICSVCSS